MKVHSIRLSYDNSTFTARLFFSLVNNDGWAKSWHVDGKREKIGIVLADLMNDNLQAAIDHVEQDKDLKPVS